MSTSVKCDGIATNPRERRESYTRVSVLPSGRVFTTVVLQSCNSVVYGRREARYVAPTCQEADTRVTVRDDRP